ncbi:MAG: hypothetical protein FWE11_03670 [Defluviitaleaceae bacterium]|nr:hypothetical protein [Defluviitaleaceae bacterium]
MFCPGCGVEINQSEVHLACSCGYVPEGVKNGPTFSGSDIVNNLTSRFGINQLIIFGGCALLLVSLFLPFVSLGMFGIVTVRQSGFALMFGGRGVPGSLGHVLNMLVPLIAVAAISLLTGLNKVTIKNPRLIILVLSGFGLYMAVSTFFHIGTQVAGVGIFIYVLLWIAVTAAAFMEYKDIRLITF